MAVTYFKLATPLYDGDTTKGCSLTSAEIDGNFNFLRGYDIKTLSYDNTAHTLTATRFDGSKIVGEMAIQVGGYTFSYDSTTGTLTIKHPDGTTQEIEIVIDAQKVNIYTDATLSGKGTSKDSLKLDSLYRTSKLTLAKACVEALPTADLKVGDRYITLEKVNKFGKLYTFSQVQAIETRLAQENKWRVPTKADWDKMLNSIETAEEDKTHDKGTDVGPRGKNAGLFIKSSSQWETSGATDLYGFGAFPVGIGLGGTYISTEFGKSTNFWTSTIIEEENEVYGKGLVDSGVSKDKVFEFQFFKDNNYSLRLVRDNDGDFQDYEFIDGVNVPCVLMDKSQQIWTKYNIGSGEGLTPTDSRWTSDDKTCVFINEWDGVKWKKRQLNEGESLPITYYRECSYGEWIVKIDNNGNYYLDSINQTFLDKLEEEKEERSRIDAQLDTKISNEITNRENICNELSRKIENEINARQSGDTELSVQISSEITARTEGDINLDNKITTETSARISAVTDLQTSLNTEKQTREDNDNAIISELEGLKIVKISDISSEYASAYELQNKDGETKGVRINILKDKFIKDVSFGKYTWEESGVQHVDEFAIRIIFYTGEAETKTIYIPAKDIFASGIGNGLVLDDNGKICVKIDTNTEEYITLSENGIKISGIDAALDKKVTKEINGTNGVALIFNEIDGGGSKFTHKDGTVSYVGVNDGGESGMTSQIYSGKWIDNVFNGTRINVFSDGIYYQRKSETTASERNNPNWEIVIKSDIDPLLTRIQNLETRITELENNFDDKVKEVVKNLLIGTDKEIAITQILSEEKLQNLKIGFADDAQFTSE